MTGSTMAGVQKTDAQDISEIVADTQSAMSFREKRVIARSDKDALPYLQYAFDRYISAKFPDDDCGAKRPDSKSPSSIVCRQFSEIAYSSRRSATRPA